MQAQTRKKMILNHQIVSIISIQKTCLGYSKKIQNSPDCGPWTPTVSRSLESRSPWTVVLELPIYSIFQFLQIGYQLNSVHAIIILTKMSTNRSKLWLFNVIKPSTCRCNSITKLRSDCTTQQVSVLNFKRISYQTTTCMIRLRNIKFY